MLDDHVCVVRTYFLEIALCHFPWKVLSIDEVHLVEQCLQHFFLYAVQLSFADRPCCVYSRACLLLLIRLIGLRVVI